MSEVGPQLVYSARERDPSCVPVARSLARHLAGKGRPADGGWILACVVAPELWRPAQLGSPARVLAIDAAALLAAGGEYIAAAELHLMVGDRARAERMLARTGDASAMGRFKDSDDSRLTLSQGGLSGEGALTTLHAIRRRALTALAEVDELVGEGQLLELLELLGLDEPAARLATKRQAFDRAGRAWERAGKPIESARAWYRGGDTEQALATLVKVEPDHPDYRSACVLAIRLAARLERLDYALDHLVGRFLETPPGNRAEQEAFALLARLYFDHGHLGPADELRRILKGEGRTRGSDWTTGELPDLPSLPPLESDSGLVPVSGVDGGDDDALLDLDDRPPGAAPSGGKAMEAEAGGAAGRKEQGGTGPESPEAGPTGSGTGAPSARQDGGRSDRRAAHRSPSVPGSAPEVSVEIEDIEDIEDIGADGERPDATAEEHGSLETWSDDLISPAHPGSVTVVEARPTSGPGQGDADRVGRSVGSVPDKLVGMVVGGRYAIEAVIGQGGTGVVYRAEDLELAEPVALKFLSGLSPDETSLARFRRELRLARRLTHHNIVRLFDLGEDRGSYFISMELLDGIVLRQAPRERLPVEQKVAIVAQAAAGLAYAHSRAVVHRDVKPDNLFLTRNGVVKVMDFGLARAAGGHHVTITGLIAGTPTYMAPEQAREFSAASAASDQYSLAVVAYELLAGRPPFVHKDVLPLLRLHAETAPSPPSRYAPELPRAVDGVIGRALAKDPHARFPDIRAFGRALCEAAGVRPTS